MVKLVKPNKKKLQEIVEGQLWSIETGKFAVSYDHLAKAYMYLGDYPNYYKAMEKAVENQERKIQIHKDNKGSYLLGSAIHRKANLLRLLFRKEESEQLFEQALEQYKLALPDSFSDNLDRYSAEIHGISDVEFHLGNYYNAIDICKYNRREKPVSEMISRAILDDNNPEILEKAIEVCKSESRVVPIGTDSGCTTSLWDFYEICLQLLELPSVLDEIEKYIKSIIWKRGIRLNE